MTSILLKKVQFAFTEIINNYNLTLREVNQDCVVLIGESFAIGILLNRDGLTSMYYDLSGFEKKAYNLDLFLVHKRREQMNFENDDKSDKPLEEYLSHNLIVFSKQLEKAGQDILNGEKTWIKSYSWPSVRVSDEVLAVV